MLLEDLLAYYNKLERPVANESEAVVLTFGLTLQQIIDVVMCLIYKEYLRQKNIWDKKIIETRAKDDYHLNAALLLFIVIAINILFDIFFWGLELEASELFEWNMNLMV